MTLARPSFSKNSRFPRGRPRLLGHSLDSLRRLQNNFFYLANIIASAPVRSVYQTRLDGGMEREHGLAQRPLDAPVLLPS